MPMKRVAVSPKTLFTKTGSWPDLAVTVAHRPWPQSQKVDQLEPRASEPEVETD